MHKNLQMALCFSTIFALPALTHASTNIKIATGVYESTKTNSDIPLLAVCKNNGDDCHYPATITSTLPAGFDIGTLNNASCSNNFCVAAGSYGDKSLHENPLLAISSNQGDTWSYVSAMPKNFDGASIVKAACNTSSCVAVGNGTTEEEPQVPFLVVSSNTGTKWSFPAGIQLKLPKNFENGDFKDVTCNDNACLAVGTTENLNDGRIVPLVAVSLDKGNSWDYSKSIYSKMPAGRFNELFINKISCDAHTCILGGTYHNDHADLNSPFLAVSHDKGLSWDYPVTILSNMPGGIHPAEIHSATCDDQACVVAGTFDKKSPMIAVSKDKGATWHYPQSILSHTPAGYLEGGFNDVNCNQNNCVAVGSYYVNETDFENEHALIAVSHDGGDNWSYVSNLPADLKGVIVSSLSCDSESCMASGEYFKPTQTGKLNAYPLLLISSDNGASWTMPNTIMSALPADFKWGQFYSGKINSLRTMKK